MLKKYDIKIIRVLKASAVFCLSHLSVYSIYQFLTFVFAKLFGLSRAFTFNKVFVESDYTNWSHFKIIVVYGFPTIILVIIGLILGGFSLRANNKTSLQYFFYWFSISAPLVLTGQLMVNFIYRVTYSENLYLGLSNVFEWLDFSTALVFTILIILIILSILFGRWKSRFFVRFYMNPGKSDERDIFIKKYYFTEQVALPIILGIIPVFLLMNENSIGFQFLLFTSYFPFIFGSFLVNKKIPLRFKQPPDIYNQIPISFLIVLLLLWTYLFLNIKDII